jgi:hypothetical protein
MKSTTLFSCSGRVSCVQKYGRETASYYRQRPDILILWTSTDCVGLVAYTTILLNKQKYGRETTSYPDNVQTFLVRRTSTMFCARDV